MGKKPKDELCFQAVKYKYSEDEDGEAMIILRVSMKDKLVAFAIPAKELLNVRIGKADS